MKKHRKALAIILVLALILGLAACGKPSGSSNTQNESAAPSNNSAPETPSNNGENESDHGNKPVDHEPEDPKESNKDVLVVYFSATGNTKGIAERIAQITDADILEIVPEEPYSEADLNYNSKSSRATKEQNDKAARPAIASETISLKSYTTIFLGYPIWFGDAPRIMSTFVEAYSFGDIMIVPFCTSGSSGIGSSAKNLEELADGGLWLDGGRLAKDISDADLKAWIDSNR